MEIINGDEIEIEERAYSEMTHYKGHASGPDKVQIWNPVFGITPADFVTAIATEKGVVEAPYRSKIAALMKA